MILYIQNLLQCCCKITFEFNNYLYKYFQKSECLQKNFIAVYIIIKIIAKNLLKFFAKSIKLLKFFAKNMKILKFFAEKSFANNIFSTAIIRRINVINSRVM